MLLEVLALAQEMTGQKKAARQTLVDLLELKFLQAKVDIFGDKSFGRANSPPGLEWVDYPKHLMTNGIEPSLRIE
ncbi:MAG: hypothetical protein ACI97A_000878 [Planctomycetota bacterium]|jgi:hypothetical protein